jgi:hypothetical protein
MANLSSLNFRLTANIAPFRKSLNKAERSMDQLGRKMQQTGKNLSMKLTAPIAALGAVSFNVFKGFEAEMSKVKAVSGATAEEFKALSDNAKDLGASTMFTAREVASLQTEFAKLGFTATEITQVTESTLALAQASGSDLARAAEVAGSTLRAFGLEASQTGRVTDVMASSFSSSALDMEHFASSMSFVAPVAKSAGMSIEETSAMLAVLANAGIKGSKAGTALRRIISEIGTTGKPVAEALKDLATQGIGLADAKDEVGRSAQSALLILAEGVDQIKPLTTQFENSAGAAKEMADTMGDNALGASKRLESAMEGLGISIGEVVAEAVVPMMEGIAKLASKLNNMSPAVKRNIVAIAALVAAAGPLVFLTGGLLRNFRFLRLAMIKSNTITKIATALQKAYNLALNANPIGVVITALTALAGVLYLVNRRKKEAVDIERKMSDEAKKEIADTQVRQTQANNLINTIKSQNISNEQRTRLIRKLNTEYGDLLPNLVDEKDSTQDIADAQKEMNKQMAKKIAMIAAQDEMSQATKDAVDAQKLYNETLKVGDDLAQKSQASFGRVLSTQDIQNYKQALQSLTPEQASLVQELDFNNQMLSVNKKKLDEANQAIIVVGESVDALAESMSTATEKTTGQSNATGELDEKTQLMKNHLNALNAEMQEYAAFSQDVEDTTLEVVDAFEEAEEGAPNFANALKKINAERKLLQDGMRTFGEVFQQAFEAGLTSGDEFFKTLKKAFTDLAKKIAATALAALALAAILSAIFGGAGAAGVRVFGVAFKGGFKELFVGIAGQMGGIPGLATGGIVTSPTLAMIGEGNESEAVLPLSKLNSLIQNNTTGSQRVEVVGRISGSDILLSQERASRNRTRQRGF